MVCSRAMTTTRTHFLVIGLAIAIASRAGAQADPRPAAPPPRTQSAQDRLGGHYYGPRLGITGFGQNVKTELESHGLHTSNAILQFGWQWEQRFVISEDSPILATGLMLLLGGAEQGVFLPSLPSLTWLIGMRGTGGTEFGLGPNLSLAGANLAIGAGVTKTAGEIFIPVNVALVIGQPGLRVSFLTGFNMNRRRFRGDEP